MTWVKICGITNLEDALVAADAGADAVGFVFYEKSPRNIRPEFVSTIVSQLSSSTEKVGVFFGTPLTEIFDIVRATRIDSVQIYAGMRTRTPESGDLSARPSLSNLKGYLALPIADCVEEHGVTGPRIRVITPKPRWGINGPITGILLDSGTSWQPGGTGKSFDWERFAPVVESMRSLAKIIVAGGLNAENVGRAMGILHPWGVDVSSGVEARPGKKDPDKVRAFVKAVREADKANSRN